MKNVSYKLEGRRVVAYRNGGIMCDDIRKYDDSDLFIIAMDMGCNLFEIYERTGKQ